MRFSAKRKSRSEIFSRIDPSVHIALGFLESHRQAEGYFKSNNYALQLALEKEVNKLKGKLQTVTLEREKLRSKNQELRGAILVTFISPFRSNLSFLFHVF